jgi:hypothetical protein
MRWLITSVIVLVGCANHRTVLTVEAKPLSNEVVLKVTLEYP